LLFDECWFGWDIAGIIEMVNIVHAPPVGDNKQLIELFQKKTITGLRNFLVFVSNPS
jgi:hypothetical protein